MSDNAYTNKNNLIYLKHIVYFKFDKQICLWNK